ncbi:MAG: LCP family protein [Clostridia bacterium]|nr:LCP family protein [Clostridia bacterium]
MSIGKSKRYKRLRRTLLIIFLVVAVIIGVSYLVSSRYLNKINRVDDTYTIPAQQEDFETDENNGLEEMEPEEVTWKRTEPLIDEDLLNFLLVGQDKRPGEGRQRSDTMIVISINSKTKEISMISFLRDLYVQIPGYSDNRLNAAYAFGGFPLLISALYTNFGISIDGSFEIDFEGFRTLINQIGGIDINLTEGEAAIVGSPTKAGMNHLDGRQALIYARIRKIGTDFARTGRQRAVLMACYEKIKQKSFSEINDLIGTALPYITTDMSNRDIYGTVFKLFSLIGSVKINSYFIPPEGTYENKYIRGMAILYPDLAAIRDILAEEYLPLKRARD